jgi:hypothetical protein
MDIEATLQNTLSSLYWLIIGITCSNHWSHYNIFKFNKFAFGKADINYQCRHKRSQADYTNMICSNMKASERK